MVTGLIIGDGQGALESRGVRATTGISDIQCPHILWRRYITIPLSSCSQQPVEAEEQAAGEEVLQALSEMQ